MRGRVRDQKWNRRKGSASLWERQPMRLSWISGSFVSLSRGVCWICSDLNGMHSGGLRGAYHWTRIGVFTQKDIAFQCSRLLQRNPTTSILFGDQLVPFKKMADLPERLQYYGKNSQRHQIDNGSEDGNRQGVGFSDPFRESGIFDKAPLGGSAHSPQNRSPFFLP